MQTTRKINWRSRGEDRSEGAAFGWDKYGSAVSTAGRGPKAVGIRADVEGARGHRKYVWNLEINYVKVATAPRDMENDAASRKAARVEVERYFWLARDEWTAEAPTRAAKRDAAVAAADAQAVTERKAQAIREAAPDLLAACEALLSPDFKREVAEDNARAAIAKARGKSTGCEHTDGFCLTCSRQAQRVAQAS